MYEALTNRDCKDTPAGPLQSEPVVPFGMTEGGSVSCAEYRQTVVDRAGTDTSNAMLGSIWVDDAIGSILDTLRHHGELDNTFILFQQDHGAEGKGSLYETGIRIAQFVHYPDEIDAGQTFDGIVSTIDIGPTVLDYAGISQDSAYPMDGKSWKQEIDFRLSDFVYDRCLYFELDYDRAVRCGCYKYIQIDAMAATSQTSVVAAGVGFTLATENVYDLCDINHEYIVSPANNPETDGTIDGPATPLRDELKAVSDCYLSYTDPSVTPDYSACSCDAAIASTLSTRTAAPTEEPVVCTECDTDRWYMFKENLDTGECETGCFDESAYQRKVSEGFECGVCITDAPSMSPSFAACTDDCLQPDDTPGFLMYKEDPDNGTCDTQCLRSEVHGIWIRDGYSCGAW